MNVEIQQIIETKDYSKSNVAWLSDEKSISTSSTKSLLKSILTQDGRGQKFKEAVLLELLKRTPEIKI